MLPLSPELQRSFIAALQRQGLSNASHAASLKWLRYYLDFCSKYYLNPTDRETPQQFMQKLNEKGQAGGPPFSTVCARRSG